VYKDGLVKALHPRFLVKKRLDIDLSTREQALKHDYVLYFGCYTRIIFTIKAVKQFTNERWAQRIDYATASAQQFGLLINLRHYPTSSTNGSSPNKFRMFRVFRNPSEE
jgi:GxxExxY protein